jgi:hypothetical protein
VLDEDEEQDELLGQIYLGQNLAELREDELAFKICFFPGRANGTIAGKATASVVMKLIS